MVFGEDFTPPNQPIERAFWIFGFQRQQLLLKRAARYPAFLGGLVYSENAALAHSLTT
jgi:hypothetical protein